MKALAVFLWGKRVGALAWQEGGQAAFEYDEDFIRSGLEVSPLMMPLSRRIFRFPELAGTKTFQGLPGVIADSLPEKFGNRMLDAYLVRHGKRLNDLNPLERLCYVGSRGMGALEYEPDLAEDFQKRSVPVEISELVELARSVLADQNTKRARIQDQALTSLISVGTSAGGAKAKAIIAVNDATGEVLSGQSDVPTGFEHWILKFDEVDNEELATSHQIGRIEYAYNEMAFAAGINVMESRLLPDGDRMHFMTKRFDRVEGNQKVHVATFAGIAHVDRDPPGSCGYERLFQTMRELRLGQDELNEMFRRMVFNICARNQDDHAKNHAFLMYGDGAWQLSPAYDICFSYKPGNPFIDSHQMSCNGKRDLFVLDDLLAASRTADVKKPLDIIRQVEDAVRRWNYFAGEAGIDEAATVGIGSLHRFFLT
jgi:serine/threonine-protein kinase HipA